MTIAEMVDADWTLMDDIHVLIENKVDKTVLTFSDGSRLVTENRGIQWASVPQENNDG